MSSPKIQGGWGWEFGPLALREELGDAECLHGSLQIPPILKDPLLSPMGNRAALEPAVGALREAGPALLEAPLPLCCCPASRPT